MTRTFITTTIPYVNGAPHVGFALEAVQADVLARHGRHLGHDVRLLSGTDDNSLKNVIGAEAAGIPVQAFVDTNADRFAALAESLTLSYDDFIRTSTDPRHRAGVDAIWHACADDLYQGRYQGLYCIGCEHYLTPDELDAAGHCPEHGTPPQRIEEHNWFFRLSRYTDADHRRDRIRPAHHRTAVPPQRGPRIPRRWPARLLGLPDRRARPRLGHPGARRPGPGHLRLVRRAHELHQQPRLRLRPGRVRPLVDAGRSPCARTRQGRAAVPCGLLAGDPALRRARAAHASAGPRLPHGRRPQDHQISGYGDQPARHHRRVRCRRAALVAAAGRTADRGHRLHHRAPRTAYARGSRRWLRQRREPGGHDDPPIPQRRRTRTAAGRRREGAAGGVR